MRFVGIALTALLASSCVVVVTSDCHDGFRNGSETDVDCGGDFCGPCGVSGFCGINRDCSTGFCSAGVCAPTGGGGSCSDGIKNGPESDIDCGGSCAKCAAGKSCLASADCQQNLCTGNVCTPHPTGAGTAPTAGDASSIKGGASVLTPSSGYVITAIAQPVGFTYRLTVLASASEFFGSLYSAGGLSMLTTGCGGACSLSTIDFVSQPYSASGGTRIDFDFLSPQGPEGFDVDVNVNTLGTPLYFDLYQDGTRVPQFTTFVAGDSPFADRAPATMPFALYVK